MKNKDRKAYLKEYEKRYREAGKREYSFVKNYGLTKEQYLQMLKAQGGRCKICGVDSTILKKKLSIDHNHKTSKVRGLLCDACNCGIGHFKDDPLLMTKAIEYILNTND